MDREHIHSHCVINSVNFDTGKKLHMAKEQLQELMRRNDMICQEMGLPVFDAPTQQARGMGGAEYHTAVSYTHLDVYKRQFSVCNDICCFDVTATANDA